MTDGIGELVRSFRVRARLSQEIVAERAGLSVRAVSDIERNVSRPRPITLSLLEEALELDEASRAQLHGSDGAAAGATQAAAFTPPSERIIGRSSELALARRALVEDRTRIVTFVGGPGYGKTALAHWVAHDVRAAFDDVCVVDLAGVAQAELVASKIALALGVRATREDGLAAAIAQAFDGRRLLLVLDTFEHVAAAKAFVGAIVAAATGLQVVATSRAALQLPDERVIIVEPLPMEEAIAMLQARAAAVRGAGAALPADGDLRRLAGALDRIPLAIELAAPLLAVASPADLVARLEHKLPLLTASRADVVPRQRTMRDAIAWSYDLLAEPERRALRRLAVIQGPFGLEAAQAVLASDDARTQPLETLQILAALARQSLVRSDDRGGTLRLQLSGLVREFAEELLEGEGEYDAAIERLAAYCVTVGAALEKRAATHPPASLARCEAALPSFDAVLGWALRRSRIERGLQVAIAAWTYWWLRGAGISALAWMRALLTAYETSGSPIDDALAIKAYNTAAAMAEACGEYRVASECCERALPIARRIGDEEAVANLLSGAGIVASEQGDYPRARAMLEEGLALRRRTGDDLLVAMSLHDLGQSAAYAGDEVAAATYLEEALAHFQSATSDVGVAMVFYVLGRIAIRARLLDRGETFLRESLRIAEGIGHATVTAGAREALGRIALHRGDVDAAEPLIRGAVDAFIASGALAQAVDAVDALAALRAKRGDGHAAARLLGAAAAQRKGEGMRIAPADLADYDLIVDEVRATLNDGAYETERTVGGALGMRRVLGALAPA